MTDWTKRNLHEVEDAAVKFGHAPDLSARFAHGDLGLEGLGLSLQRLAPGKRQPFGHRHREHEEVYVILAGSGQMLVGDETVDVAALDAIRVAPETLRAFEAGDEGLEWLVFGPHGAGDAEIVPDPFGT